MGSYRIKRGDVGKAELAESILKDRDTSLRRCGGVRGGVDGFDYFINLRGNERICNVD